MEKYGYISEYYTAIRKGKIVAGKKVKAAYKRICDGLKKKEFFYSRKKAMAAILFVEQFCHHHEGAKAPGLIELELWQKAFLSVIFGVVGKDGKRQFREIFLVMGRKNGKTLLASAIAEILLYFDGEQGARVYFAAPKLEQARLCFDATYQSIKCEDELEGMTQKRRTDIYVPSTDSTAKPLAFSEKKSDGLNISFAVCDEVASWHGDQGLKFYEVLRSSFGAREQPMLLDITTAGYENEGIYDELMKRATRWLDGGSTETRFFPLVYQIDDARKWANLKELQKANPNLGVSVTPAYFEEEIQIARGSLSKKNEFLTKYCNIKQNSTQAWLKMSDVEKACGEPLRLEDFRETYCTVGIDLSRTTDLTACVAAIERDGVINLFAKFFLPSSKIDEASARDGLPYRIYIERGFLQASGDNMIDYRDCYDWVMSLIYDMHIYPLQVGYDRYCASYLVQDLKAAGCHCDDVYQGTNLTPVIKEFEGLLKDGKINIGDNDLLKVHFLDSALKIETENDRCRLIKMRKMAHIDGMAATLDAICVRQKWYEEIGQQLKNED